MKAAESVTLPPTAKKKLVDSLSRFVTTNKRTFVPKGWGYEDWIANNDLYCGKILFFKQGKRCSVHYHEIKDETFYLLDGELEVTVLEPDYWDASEIKVVDGVWDKVDVGTVWTANKSKKRFTMKPGDSFHLPVRMIHSMYGALDSRLMEVSMTHVEEDSIRLIKGD